MRVMMVLLFLCVSILALGQALNSPESVVVDYSNSYMDYMYVSNVGNGQILKKAYYDTEYTVFASGLGSVRGLCIYDHILYANCNLGLARFDLITQQNIGNVVVPGSMFLNDVIADSSGNIYMSDGQANKIFKYNIANGTVGSFISTGVQNPNGMAFDTPNNRILLVSYRANSPIQAIQLPNGELSTVLTTNIGNLDGIGIDGNGAIYFSSWQTNSIYRMTSINAYPVQVWTGLSGPADFFLTRETLYYFDNNDIVIPNMNSNTMSVYHLPNFVRDFYALYVSKYPELGVQWRSYFEVDLEGYYVYVSTSGNDFSLAELVTDSIITAQNTLDTEYGPYDWNFNYPIGQFWWIQSNEMDGTEHLFGPFQAIGVENEDIVTTPIVNYFNVYPNPVIDNSILSFELTKNEEVIISIYDVKGRCILKKHLGVIEKGKQTINLNSAGLDFSGLASGIYFCRLLAGKQVLSRKISIIK